MKQFFKTKKAFIPLSFFKKNLKGFTLIELLVVIAIFGLLVSVVVVSTSSARKKGSEAAGRQFSATLQHSLGADAVGMWSFDEGSGTTAKDSSGNNFNGTRLFWEPLYKTHSETQQQTTNQARATCCFA